MTPDAVPAHLRQEVATLRKQMNDLLHFITIEREKGAKVPNNMILRCGIAMFQNPHAPGTTQMFMGGSADGPFLSLWDSKGKGRVILSVEKDVPNVSLYSAEVKEDVRIEADPEHGRGVVAVFENRKARAVVKAGPDDSGSVSIVHDDGQSRITMHGTEDTGCLMAVSPDMQVVAKISSNGLNGGGAVVVNGSNGKPDAFLTAGLEGGAVIVNGPDGKPAASLPDVGFGPKKGEE